MKLSDFQNEDALDLLANIIDPAAEIMNDQKVVKIFKERPPLFAVKEILMHHKQAAIEIVAAIHGKKPSEFKFNIITLTSDVLDLLNDPEIAKVFSSQSQTGADTSSGSAMESTEDEEQ